MTSFGPFPLVLTSSFSGSRIDSCVREVKASVGREEMISREEVREEPAPKKGVSGKEEEAEKGKDERYSSGLTLL